MQLEEIVQSLVCPRTYQSLSIVSKSNGNLPSGSFTTVRRTGAIAQSIGTTETMLVNNSSGEMYPVIDGFPILLAPELLVSERDLENYPVVDLQDLRYAEAYEEMKVYNSLCEKMIEDARKTGAININKPMGALTPSMTFQGKQFPEPEEIWIDAKHDSLSQLEAYAYLAPIKDQTFVQLGGSGSHAVKALVAGASKAFLLTPMIGEARVAMYLAERYGVADNMACVIAIGEELPFTNDSIDLVYSGGCFHHMRLDYASVELHRVLRKGGKFSGVDPWKTPLHTIGTNLIGKREKSVFCKPITPERLAPMQKQFSDIKVVNHGPLLRYLFLAFEKIGIDLSVGTMLRIGRSDDKLGKLIGLSKFGGSLMIAGRK